METFIRTLGARYGHGHVVGDHAHGWGQLIYASEGAIHVTAAGQTWLIPSARAVWLPPRTPHRLRMRGTTRLRTLYIPPARCGDLAPMPLGLMVSPLLRELIEELVRIGHVAVSDPAHRALAQAMLVMLARSDRLPFALKLPTDRRAMRAAEHILGKPGRDMTLDALAKTCGASLRTLQRRFQDETGMSLSDLRRRARLMAASALLLDGRSVTDAALEAGYGGVSAFGHAFRGTLGQTPSSFRRALPPLGNAI